MSGQSKGGQLTKDDIRKEIKKETKAYRRKRRLSTLALILVLVAIILLFIFADEKGLLGNGTSLGFGDKATDVVNQAANTLDKVNEKIKNKTTEDSSQTSKEELVKNNENKQMLDVEKEQDKVIVDNLTIEVKGKEILYKDNSYTKVDELKEALLNEEFKVEDVLTLQDNKAIKATYEEVKNMLDEFEGIQYIEE